MIILRQPKRRPHNFVDLTGQTFGRITVTVYAGVGAAGASWFGKCACGKDTQTNATKLRGGLIVSCGCHRNEMSKRAKTHGLSRIPEHAVWNTMKQRCDNPKSTSFAHYGARGIKVCQRWADSFEAFLADMGRRPSVHHSIDRFPDNNGNYEPGNCRWATRSEQQRHKRSNITVEWKGTTMTLAECCEKAGMTDRYATVWWRIRHGQTIEDAVRC